MGVYGALLTGVTGLAGQSTKMGAISDNIANVNTVGYKKADVPFQSLVTDPFGRSTTYSPGGVLSKPRQLISQQGVISGTASATDFAISGRGFFIVSEETSASIDNSRFYTRSGSFRAAIDPNDAQAALLQNTGGFYLTGIPVADRDTLPDPTSLTQLETVNINRISNSARATEEAKVQANLPSELAQSGATLTIFNPDGTQKAFLSGTTTATGASLDPTQVQVTVGDPTGATNAGDIRINRADGTTLTLTAADYLAPQTTAGVTANNAISTGGAVFFNGADLTFTVDTGDTVTITQAALAAAGTPFTDGVSNATTLAQAITAIGTAAGAPSGTTYNLTAAVTGDQLSISATNAGSGEAVSTSNIGGIDFVGTTTPTVAAPGAPPPAGADVTIDFGSPGPISLNGAGLDFIIDGNAVSISNAALIGAGFVEGTTTAAGLIGIIQGFNAQPGGATSYDFAGSTIAGDVITIDAADNAATPGDGTIAVGPNLAAATVQGPDTTTNADAQTEVSTTSLDAFVKGLNGFEETARITALATDAVSFPGTAPRSFTFTLEDGSDSITINEAALPTTINSIPAVFGAADIAALATQLNGQSVTTANGRDVTLQASHNGDRFTLRAIETTSETQIAIDPASIDGNDFLVGAPALPPVVDADSNVDITALIDTTTGFLSISAFEDGQQIDIDLSDVDIADTVVNEANTTDNGVGTGVIAGSKGDFAETFTSSLTQTQQIFDALGTEHSVQLEYRKRDDEANLWEVRIADSGVSDFVGEYDPSGSDNNGARFVVQDTGNATIETQRLFIRFNGDGSLAEVRTTRDGASGTAFGQRGGGTTTGVVQNRETDISEDPKLISIAIGEATIGANGESVATPVPDVAQGANFVDNGAEAVVFEWNIGRPTDLDTAEAGTGLDGLTQFDSGEATPTIEQFFYSQDGARFGNLAGVQIDDNGTLFALFDNGVVEPIYVIPLATFNNPDGLINQTGNVFAESPDSGQVQVKRAGEQGAGDVLGSAVENSNVDLGDEFTNMIITQQSFTANTRVITTSDRMLEELVRILR